jgi:simple sugar transport system permease protein
MSAAEMAAGIATPSRRAWPAARRIAGRSLGWVTIYAAALAIFGAFVSTRGVDPIAMYRSMWAATLTGGYGPGQVLDRAAPFILAALAVAIPARAGLVNIGGEGQIVIGATAAGGIALALGGHASAPEALVLMALAAAVAGAAWAGLAALLKLQGNVDEAISTLLLNYVGANVLSYLVFGPWKDAHGSGQPGAPPLSAAERLPAWNAIQGHIGILVALALAAVVALALWRTRWGFALRCVGGNREAARRAGLGVPLLIVSAMLAGGALAGLAGMIQLSGMEGQLRPGIAATFGYTAFLASWLARHRPVAVVAAATLLATIAVAGDSLQISSHLPGSVVNVLMAVVLLGVLSKRRTARMAA